MDLDGDGALNIKDYIGMTISLTSETTEKLSQVYMCYDN